LHTWFHSQNPWQGSPGSSPKSPSWWTTTRWSANCLLASKHHSKARRGADGERSNHTKREVVDGLPVCAGASALLVENKHELHVATALRCGARGGLRHWERGCSTNANHTVCHTSVREKLVERSVVGLCCARGCGVRGQHPDVLDHLLDSGAKGGRRVVLRVARALGGER
jgi:hypothetical protein